MIQANPQATQWTVPDELDDPLRRLVELEGAAKAADAVRQELKAQLLAWADEQLCLDVRGEGELPATPIRLVASSGASLAYVCQAARAVPDQALPDLQQALGEHLVTVVERRHAIAVDVPIVDGQDELVAWLADVVAEALKKAEGKLRRILTADQRQKLVSVTTTTKLRRDALERLLGTIDKRSFPRLFRALGPGLTRYLRA